MLFFACSGKGKIKKDLKTAITTESDAMNKYNLYSDKAVNENYINISRLFKALSEANKINLINHQLVLQSWGDKFEPKIFSVDASLTLTNLQSSITDEQYKNLEIYPNILNNLRKKNFPKLKHHFNMP